ncbi:MAG: NADH-quinone oxidoreductase subunit NuoN [Ktedonobacterales bacterium]|nr:NADH-quinone oxidoreductase subunit NuoN [Ktedonobacterales bacterium]
MIFADTPIGANPFSYIPGSADWLRILPELFILVAALVVLLADLFAAPGRKGWLALVGLLGVGGAFTATGVLFTQTSTTAAFFGMISADSASLFADLVILFALGLGLLFSPGYIERQDIPYEGEYYALLLLAALGMMLLASGTNLMILFVGLEALSLALYVLAAIVPGRRRSQEAGMKYFILSSFASAFLLYGMAMTYGGTGSTNLDSIRAFLDTHAVTGASGFGPLLLVGLGLMAVGFCFKVSAVPFQAWTPDVYVGAPTSVTAFMSVGTKVAAFVALARVFVYALHGLSTLWIPVFWVVAVLTMVIGNVMAVTQRDVKRMLAYSSVANAGYLLVAIVTNTQASIAALLVFLAAYGAMNVSAFGVVLAVERNNGLGTRLDDFAGLAGRRPWLAAAMAVFLFALAGVPVTVGFVGKYDIFYAAITGGHLELAIIGVMTSILGMYYYLRVIWAMYFIEPRATPAVATETAPLSPPVSATPALTTVPALASIAGGGAAVSTSASRPTAALSVKVPSAPLVVAATAAPSIPLGTWLALVLGVLFTLGLGIVPAGLFALARQAAAVLFR